MESRLPQKSVVNLLLVGAVFMALLSSLMYIQMYIDDVHTNVHRLQDVQGLTLGGMHARDARVKASWGSTAAIVCL